MTAPGAGPRAASEPLSVRAALAGRRLLVTGASGFLGKVWLAHLLAELPELGTVSLLVRPERGRGALARLEDLLSTSPAFAPLHERWGARLGDALAGRLAAVEGDVAQPACGLSAETLADLRGRLDLVVHLAGLTDLDPDPADAVAANVRGALHALDVARATGARLVHVSTAYVAGCRPGRVPEQVVAGAPRAAERAAPFDAEAELAWLDDLRRRARSDAQDPRAADALAREARSALDRAGRREEPGAREAFTLAAVERWARARTAADARDRARFWGWPNIYTYTKALAEVLLARRAGAVPVCVVRPSIVESALEFPFPGWKEGLHTSAPLVYAMTRGPLRAVPARAGLRLDVVPVDVVARALTLACAAHARGEAPAVVQVGTSDLNPLDMGRALELTALAERAAEAPQGPLGRDDLRRLARPDPFPAGDARYRATSVPLLRRLAAGARAALSLAAEAAPGLAARARTLARRAGRAERRLADLEDTVERFRPFVLENDCTFATDALADLAARLVAGERAAFGVDLLALEWRRYWIEVHVPGLRRWAFPRLEGKRVEAGERRPVRLAASGPRTAAGRAGGRA